MEKTEEEESLWRNMNVLSVCLGINFPAQLLRSCQIMRKMCGSVVSHQMAPDWPRVQRTAALSFTMSIRYCRTEFSLQSVWFSRLIQICKPDTDVGRRKRRAARLASPEAAMGMKFKQPHFLSLEICGRVASPIPLRLSSHWWCAVSELAIAELGRGVIDACGAEILSDQISVLAGIWIPKLSIGSPAH